MAVRLKVAVALIESYQRDYPEHAHDLDSVIEYLVCLGRMPTDHAAGPPARTSAEAETLLISNLLSVVTAVEHSTMRAAGANAPPLSA